MTLNAGQQAAADGFFQFLFSDQKELIISGPGGTGKTHLMSEMIDAIIPEYFNTCKLMNVPPLYREVEMTATTNKAAEVLAQATRRPTSTIHSFLNLKVEDDYSTGRSNLTKGRNWRVHERKIVFVDEGSMVDTPLRSVIHEGLHNSKIVYVGDHCQLAPVFEPISPIYRANLPFFKLTQPMRTDNPQLLALQQQLRETVETGVFKPIRIIPGVIDWLDNTTMPQQIGIEFAQQTQASRILAFTNQRVMEFNDFIRSEVRHLGSEYTIGEYLVNNSAIRLRNGMLSVEEDVTITDQADAIEEVLVDEREQVFLQVRYSTLRTSIGTEFDDVPVPVDRVHYAELIKYYRRRKRWDRYFHIKNTFPDLRQRDAATVHKAQGSTYDSVFIDAGNISTCNVADQVARMLYVAVTRPRQRIFFYGDLAGKYGGLVR